MKGKKKKGKTKKTGKVAAASPKMDKSSPQDLNLLGMIESRIMEVIQIEDECKKKLPKLFHQRLPRFMRRRAACHNPKRLPKKLRPTKPTDFGSKSRAALLKYRRRLKFRKNKRILVKHARHKYKDPDKSLLHKWFAKRFKMETQSEQLRHMPIHNSTKNRRNLYRQSRSGCAYIALGHLSAIKLKFQLSKDDLDLSSHLELLNRICREISGFTFLAKSLRSGRYEIAIHLFDPDRQSKTHTCVSLVTISQRSEDLLYLTLWVPRDKLTEVTCSLDLISKESDRKFSIERIYPKDCVRIRLVGPSAYKEAMRIADNKDNHLTAIKDVEERLSEKMGSTIGRHLQEEQASFTYYNTVPMTVDVVFKNSGGRLLWHKLVKNRAHLVGGYRDIGDLLKEDCFQIKPDYA